MCASTFGRFVRAGALTLAMALASVSSARASIPKTPSLETRVNVRAAIEQPLCKRDAPVPILMYHHIGEPEDRFTVSPSRLRAHIDNVRTAGYELQTFGEYAQCAPTPSGKPAAVITFDDSTEDQYRILSDGTTDPKSAFGVLEGYRAAHPEWRVTSTFFVNATTDRGLPAFEQPGLEGQKLLHLHERGYEVGAHGFTHKDFKKLTPAKAARDADTFLQWMTTTAPGVNVTSFAYPYGSIPSSQVRAAIDARFTSTAHAWGGTANTTTRLVPRIETGPATILAKYVPEQRAPSTTTLRLAANAPIPHTAQQPPQQLTPLTTTVRLATHTPSPHVALRNPDAVRLAAHTPSPHAAQYLPQRHTPIATTLRFATQTSAPQVAFRNPDANVYKEIGVRRIYDERHHSQLPSQPPRLHGRSDDRGSRWYRFAREGQDVSRQEGRLLDGQEGHFWRDSLSAWQLWRPARAFRDWYAWSSDWHTSQHPVGILPKPPRVVSSYSAPNRVPGPIPVPVTPVVLPPTPRAWYDKELSHSTVSAVLANRQRDVRRLSWWPF